MLPPIKEHLGQTNSEATLGFRVLQWRSLSLWAPEQPLQWGHDASSVDLLSAPSACFPLWANLPSLDVDRWPGRCSNPQLCTGYLSDACLLVLLRYLAFGGLCQQALSLGVWWGSGGEGGSGEEQGLGSENLRISTSNGRSCLNLVHFTWPPNYRVGLESCLPLVKTWLSYLWNMGFIFPCLKIWGKSS